MSEVDTYKIFRELEARGKRANPYKFYDKDELIDEILKDEDEIERLNNIIKDIDTYIHLWKLDDIGEKTMLILNDILLIKNGMRNEVVRLGSEKE